MKKEESNLNVKTKKIKILDIIYYIVVIPLLIIEISIVFQKIKSPDIIPNVFGYKMFMILDGKMDKHVEDGDLIISKNYDVDLLEIGDVIAFRNDFDTVTIHEISNIEQEKNSKKFTMKTLKNETNNTKYVEDKRVEGLIVNKIPKLGLILFTLQKPITLLIVMAVIFTIGGIAYFIAGKLDEKEEKKVIVK